MGDDRHLSEGEQQNPDSETQDTLGPRETTLPRLVKEDGPESFGVGGCHRQKGNEKSEDKRCSPHQFLRETV